jgi:hypothetical protein
MERKLRCMPTSLNGTMVLLLPQETTALTSVKPVYQLAGELTVAPRELAPTGTENLKKKKGSGTQQITIEQLLPQLMRQWVKRRWQ